MVCAAAAGLTVGVNDAQAVELPPWTYQPGTPPPSWWWAQASASERASMVLSLREAEYATTRTLFETPQALGLFSKWQYGTKLERLLFLAGRSPAMEALGPIGVAVGIGLIAWQIREQFTDGNGDTQYRDYYEIFKAEYFGQQAVVDAVCVAPEFCTRTLADWSYFATQGAYSGSPAGWYFRNRILIQKTGSSASADTQHTPHVQQPDGHAATCQSAPIGCYGSFFGISNESLRRAGVAVTDTAAALDGAATPLVAEYKVMQTPCAGDTVGISCRGLYISAIDFGDRAIVTRSDVLPAGVTLQNPGAPKTRTDPGAVTAAQAEALTDKLAADACAKQAFDAALAPGYFQFAGCDPSGQPLPTEHRFVLPRPDQLETWPEYVTRLRNLGWLGTLTITTLSAAEADPMLGASGVSAVRLEDGRLVRTTFWPATTIQLDYGESVRLVVNPVTGIDGEPLPPPGDPLPPPSDDPPPPDAPPTSEPPYVPPPDCDCPPVDFSPLRVGASSKFPFGLLVWAGALLAQFDVAPVTPSFTISKPGGGTLVVNFGSIATARAVADPVLKFVIVVASVWYGATMIVRVHRGEGNAGAEE